MHDIQFRGDLAVRVIPAHTTEPEALDAELPLHLCLQRVERCTGESSALAIVRLHIFNQNIVPGAGLLQDSEFAVVQNHIEKTVLRVNVVEGKPHAAESGKRLRL